MVPVRELVLVRHGETTGQSSIRLNGATDVPLSDLGRSQLQAVRAALAGERWDRVLTSPLVRARESTAIVVPDLTPEIVPDFTELNFGAWETLTYAEVRLKDPAIFEEMQLGLPEFRFPGGESRQGFLSRVANAAHRYLNSAEIPARPLVVAHKGTIKGITAALLGDASGQWARAESCDLASIHRFERHGTTWRRVLHNATDHLGELWQADHPARPLAPPERTSS